MQETPSVTMMLADSAQAVNGKLYILGGGWSIAGPGPVTFSIVVKIQVPWEQANQKQQMLLRLEDGDGQVVEIGGKKMEFPGEFEVGRPSGVPIGIPIDLKPMVVNLHNAQLEPGSRYVWRMLLNGESHPAWTLSFTTRRQKSRATS
ncbi:MAG: hypothetical protein WD602_05360 [Actinomycetota bacterium]